MENELLPGLVHSQVLLAQEFAKEVEVVQEGRVCELAHTSCRRTTDHVLVRAKALGEGFLEESAPESVILTKLAKEKLSVDERQVVVNEDSVRDAKHVEVKAVDAIGILLVAAVEEEVPDSHWVLVGERGGACLEPESSLITLVEVLRHRAVRSEQW